MYRIPWPCVPALLAFAAYGGCDSLILTNPRNCGENPNACTRDELCNPQTLRCETLDCTVNVTLCTSSQYCEPTTSRCTAKDCVVDATLCSSTQDCEPTTRQCVTRAFVLGQPAVGVNINLAYGMRSPYAAQLIPSPALTSPSKLAVCDSANSRVLLWNSVPAKNTPADSVLGMPDIHTLSLGGPYGGVSEFSISSPSSLSSDGTRLIVADQGLQRVLIWNMIPTQTSGMPIAANHLWGQNSFNSSGPNAGLDMPNSQGLSFPEVFVERSSSGSGTFFISERANNRILVFSAVPDTPNFIPSFVVGQPDFTSNQLGTTAMNLHEPRNVASDGTQLYVPDFLNHRILSFALPITNNNPTATAVFGQPDFASGLPNRGGGPTAASLFYPPAVALLKGPPRLLFAVDQLNHRVLRYSLPGTTADLVLGQPNFTSNLANRGGAATAATLNQPLDVSSDGTRLVVTDYGNSRVLIWNSLPTANGQSADVVMGQPSPSAVAPNNPAALGVLQYGEPSDVASDGTALAVSDTDNNRVLLWRSLPRTGDISPDVVLGQSSFTTNQPNTGLPNPTGGIL